MTRVLVTGASGQLGMAIRALAGNYRQVDFHFADRSALDITDRKAVETLFSENHYDYCINCAAYTNVEQAEKTPRVAFEINEEGVANLAMASKLNDAVLIHISTDYVFDGQKAEGYLPTDTPNPINQYGKSKWEGENRIQKVLKRYFIIRTSWLYSQRGRNFYTNIKKRAALGGTISVTNQEYGCPTHADHLAKYIMDLVDGEKKSFGIYHYTDGEAMTWYEFAKKILLENRMSDSVRLLATKSYPSVAKRPAYSILIS